MTAYVWSPTMTKAISIKTDWGRNDSTVEAKMAGSYNRLISYHATIPAQGMQ